MAALDHKLIVFRADSSVRIGTGHVVRCLTLAKCLAPRTERIIFICRTAEGGLVDLIKASGFEVLSIPGELPRPAGQQVQSQLLEDDWEPDATQCLELISSLGKADWLIVDHYALDAHWEKAIRPVVKHIMVIDDLANRPHDCDLLLDQTYGENGTRFRGLLPSHCRSLSGASYALLRPEFAVMRAQLAKKMRAGEPNRVHVFFGGSDLRRNTLRFARLVLVNFSGVLVTVAVGAKSSFELELRELAAEFQPRLAWEKDIENMARHMSTCDIAIGAPGMATWERACLGIPSAYISVSENQVAIVRQLAARGFCAFIGADNEISDNHFVGAFKSFLGDTSKLSAMRDIGMAAIDGLGTERVAAALSELALQ